MEKETAFGWSVKRGSVTTGNLLLFCFETLSLGDSPVLSGALVKLFQWKLSLFHGKFRRAPKKREEQEEQEERANDKERKLGVGGKASDLNLARYSTSPLFISINYLF